MAKLGDFLVAFLLCFSFFSAHAKTEVKVYASPSALEIGDVVDFTIDVESDEKIESLVNRLPPPKIDGLEYQGVAPSSGTMVNYSNGKVTTKYSQKLTITYAATKEGVFSFPSLDLEGEGTKALKIRVYKKLPENLKKQRRMRRRRSNPFSGSGTLMDQLFGNSEEQDEDAGRPLEFFTEVEIDKKEIFKGEQMLATWYIYVTPGARLGTFDTLSFPTLKGFWKEDVKFASTFYWKPVTKNGKRYRRALLSSYALTPYKSGSYVIDPFKLRTVVTRGFFNAKRRVLKAQSEAIKITVKPLPQPIPESFTGGVGRFKVDNIKTVQRRGAVFLGEPFDLSFRIVGDLATTKFLTEPKLDLEDSFKLYKVKEDHRFIASRVSSFKTFKYSLIPKKIGAFRFPDIQLTFLDADTGEYYSEYVKLPTYRVMKNQNASKILDENFDEESVADSPAAQNVFATLTPDSKSALTQISEFVYTSFSYLWVALFLLLGLLASFVLYFKVSSVELRQESLAVDLDRRAQAVSLFLQNNKRNQALTELINILSLLVGAVNGKRYGAEKEIEQAVRSLPPGLKSSGEKLKKLNDDLQEMRFGSSLESQTNKAKLEGCLKDFKKLFLEFREYLR